ncbi:hypothetical protein E6O75_ATG02416 [Venturia nashicola]|uniref:Uncharacterized protein n=1 Tax=Venturia nashicola TaxID=86259 RepID=A0A4Z1PFE2_9PEZI|nr:hypothetical protein E6O75_ATG02416 [Venturia nashicola]
MLDRGTYLKPAIWALSRLKLQYILFLRATHSQHRGERASDAIVLDLRLSWAVHCHALKYANYVLQFHFEEPFCSLAQFNACSTLPKILNHYTNT